jgi:hypothetical protein
MVQGGFVRENTRRFKKAGVRSVFRPICAWLACLLAIYAPLGRGMWRIYQPCPTTSAESAYELSWGRGERAVPAQPSNSRKRVYGSRSSLMMRFNERIASRRAGRSASSATARGRCCAIQDAADGVALSTS